MFPLTPGLFDLVIFDEASQCPIEQALPIVYRGKRVVVAGDEKQLPPTSFFSPESSGAEDDETEDGAAEDVPVLQAQQAAITQHVTDSEDLLAAAVASLPHDYLAVHYRSEHPALIEFSNRAFYNGLLEAPPSRMPPGSEQPPIRWVEVNGLYEAGKRVNRVEAQRVVEEVKTALFMEKHPTIGVVTFNQPQRELIQDLLESERLRDRAFAEKFDEELNRRDNNQDVGLFVKNLENVQGDERDVMIFSTTFGPTSEGKMQRRFGPVGQRGGERRLNVAITRAKRRIVVVSSMPVNEISTALLGDQGAGAGITPSGYLQLYMAYAQSISNGEAPRVARVLDLLKPSMAVRGTGDTESPLEEEIKEALDRMGYVVDSQVGVGGFRIDLAVKHRDPRLGYVLGIECDGAAYHSDRSARLRDVWRQSILQERYGWRMHRVWSTRWWHYRHEEISKLTRAIDTAIGQTADLALR